MSNQRFLVKYDKFSNYDFRNIMKAPKLYSHYFFNKLGLDKKFNYNMVLNYDAVISITKIFQIFQYSFAELNIKDLKVYFVCDEIPTIDVYYNKRYSIVYSDTNEHNFISENDPRVKDFNLWFEKVLLFDGLISNVFTKNGVIKYNTEIVLTLDFIKNILNQYNYNGCQLYQYCLTYNSKDDKQFYYIKYRDNNELIKKMVLIYIDKYPNLFLNKFYFCNNLFEYLFKIISNEPFIFVPIFIN